MQMHPTELECARVLQRLLRRGWTQEKIVAYAALYGFRMKQSNWLSPIRKPEQWYCYHPIEQLHNGGFTTAALAAIATVHWYRLRERGLAGISYEQREGSITGRMSSRG
jgi:hypothetical protein